LPPAVLKLLVIDGGKDGLRINDLFPGLLADDQGIRHQVVDHAGIALGVAVDGGRDYLKRMTGDPPSEFLELSKWEE